MLRQLGWITVSVLSFALFSSDSFASNRPGALTLSANGGYLFFSPKRDINNTGILLAGVGYQFTEHWGMEGLIGTFNTDSKNSSDNRNVDGTEFILDVMYRFAPIMNHIEPYLMAGPGISSFNPNDEHAHTQGSINAGLGAQYFINKSVAFTLEGRDIYQIVSTTNDVMLNAGISFLLDLC